MYKKIAFLFVLQSLLYSSNLPYTMYAKKVDSFADRVVAFGGVVIYHNDSIYHAKRAVFHKKSHLLELFDDVKVVSKDSSSTTNYLKIYIKSKKSSSEKFFIYSGGEGLWLRGSSYSSKKGIYTVKNSEVSSCRVKDPDWKILFSKGRYNQKSEFITLNRPTFYFKGWPLFALPWFAFPTIKERKSGLLRPRFGVLVDSGFIYMQPYFWAPRRDWDLTITPQIRSKRGFGIYNEINFVDTKNSFGRVRFGYFREKESFYKRENLKNKEHKGISFYYKSSRFLPFDLDRVNESGLYVDLKDLNDIDYENLKDINIHSYNKLVTSRINYFIKRDSDYIGLYLKYFIDTDKVSNTDTMQELPTLQYHLFTKSIFLKNLTYSFDYKVKNNYRKKGLNAIWHEINLPIKFDIPLFNDYMNFSMSENLYYSKIDYSNLNDNNYKNAKYFSNYHKFVLSSDLTKPYNSFLHNLQLQASLQVPSFEDKSGDFADFININKERKNLTLSLNQYFYNKEGLDFLTIRSSQIIYLDNKREYGDILNDIVYKFSKNTTITENTVYSKKYSKLTKLQTTFSYHEDRYNFNLSHTFNDEPKKSRVNFLTGKLDFNLDGGFKIGATINKDIQNSFTKDWSVWLYRDKKCWNYKISYKESLVPISTSGGAKSYRNRGVYFLVNFANIGGISYKYTKNDIE